MHSINLEKLNTCDSYFKHVFYMHRWQSSSSSPLSEKLPRQTILTIYLWLWNHFCHWKYSRITNTHFHYHHKFCIDSIETFPVAEIHIYCYQQHDSRLCDHISIWNTISYYKVCGWVYFMTIAKLRDGVIFLVVRLWPHISTSVIWI